CEIVRVTPRPRQHPHRGASLEQGAYDIGPNKTCCTSHQGCHTNDLHVTYSFPSPLAPSPGGKGFALRRRSRARGSKSQRITLPGPGGEKNAGASAANGVLPPGIPTTSAGVAARAVG